MELRLRSRMLAAFADSGPGTAAVASAASAWMCCLHALFRLLISSPFNNRNLKSRNIISLSPPPPALAYECTYSFASSGIRQQCSYFQLYWALTVGGGRRYMGVEWAYFVLVSLEFASYHSDAKRALCDTQIFVGNEWL